MTRPIARADWLALALAAPAVLLLVAGLALPLAEMAVISFFRYSSILIWEPVFTLDNYAQFFSGFYLAAGIRTLWLSAMVTALCIVIGYPFAIFLARSDSRLKPFYLFVLLSPLMMSSVVLVLGWNMILSRQGPLSALLGLVGLQGFSILYSKTAIVIGLTALQLPFMVMILRNAVERVPQSVEEAAHILGAGRMAIFWRVTLPLTHSGLISGTLLVFAMGLGSLVAPALLGGSRDIMIGNVIYESVMVSLNWPFAAAVSLILLVTTLVLMAGYLGFLRGSSEGRS